MTDEELELIETYGGCTNAKSVRCPCCSQRLEWPEHPLNHARWELELASFELPMARAESSYFGYAHGKLCGYVFNLCRMGFSHETAWGLVWNADFVTGKPA
jgi:hypothetical protein